MRYVVGYRPDASGADAVALAVALARTQQAELHLVTVVPGSAHDYEARAWWALSLVPADVSASFSLRSHATFAEGLIRTAVEDNATLIIVGAGGSGFRHRAAVSASVNELLQGSPISVALAPRGYNRTEPITRLTVMVGMREGWQAALVVAAAAAVRLQVPLRLVSLVEVSRPRPGEPPTGPALTDARQHVAALLTRAAAQLQRDEVTVAVAQGNSIETAAADLEWRLGEIVIVGSSRLAEHHQTYLGGTALKMLRVLPAPLVVVPRD